MTYIADSMDGALRAALGDYIAISPDFFISGDPITETPSGTSFIYTATAGYVCYKGEVMPIEAQSVLKLASQVVFITVQDDGADTTPVPNMDGNTDYVMRKRHAKLRVASVYPTEYMALTAPRKEALDRLRLKGRIVMPGGMIPYSGPLTDFDSTGLGQVDTVMEGWAVCNGLNGTPDMRGMVPLGATNVPDSGAPSPYAGSTENTDPGDKVGADKVTLVADQLPAHKHPIAFPSSSYWSASGGGANITAPGTGDGTGSFPTETDDNVTAADQVDVRQPSFAVVWLMSIA